MCDSQSVQDLHPNGITDPGEECDGDAPRYCLTSCGSTGTQACVACSWEDGCTPPGETCNGEDDDCDDATDDGYECPRGSSESCTVGGCDGSRRCSSSCAWEDCLPTTPPPPPAPLTPENGAYSGSLHAAPARGTLRPTFRWVGSPACGLDPTYELQVDDSCATPGFATCGFPSPEARVAGIDGDRRRLDGDLPVASVPPVGRRYYWRVRACFGTNCGAWSPVRYVEVGRPPNDYNGDGYSDILAGSATGGYVYLGGAAPDSTADVTFSEARVCYVGAGGDINADGFADVMLGCPMDPGSGWVRVYLGGATVDSTGDLMLDTTERNNSFGISVTGAGDVNADGYGDMIVGSPRSSGSSGWAFFYFGGGAPDDVEDVIFAVGAPSTNNLGRSVAGLGDMNGDGYSDVAVGEPLNGSGRAYVFFGGAVVDTAADLSIAPGPAPTARLGWWVGKAGDVDGDGYADLLVGTAEDPTASPAEAYLFLGSAWPDATADVTYSGPSADGFGRVAVGGGDLDGDGLADLVVTAATCDVGGTDAGCAYLHLGSGAPDATPDLTLSGPAASTQLGVGAASTGDFNGDGFADLVLSGSARTCVYFGSAAFDATADLTINPGGGSVALRSLPAPARLVRAAPAAGRRGQAPAGCTKGTADVPGPWATIAEAGSPTGWSRTCGAVY
jgi:hypothetical protein